MDGVPTSFLTIADGERFAAVGRIENRTITIAGHGAAGDLELSTLDPSGL